MICFYNVIYIKCVFGFYSSRISHYNTLFRRKHNKFFYTFGKR